MKVTDGAFAFLFIKTTVQANQPFAKTLKI